MLAACQKWVDSSCSKTINCDPNIPFEEFKEIYMYAYDNGCKGITTYRPNNNISAVLINPEEQSKRMYKFELENGEIITVPGNEEVEYEGTSHIAANLAEAIIENQYRNF